MNDRVIFDHDALASAVETRRAAGDRIVFANGCFDVLHVGHVRYLEAARACGDALIVALNDDAGVRGSKGEGRPFTPEADRVEILAALRCVTWVTVFSESTVDALLLRLRPDVHAKGTDWTEETVPERATVLSYGGTIRIVGDPKERSSTDFIRRLRE